jgi:hypothetical protein
MTGLGKKQGTVLDVLHVKLTTYDLVFFSLAARIGILRHTLQRRTRKR